MDVVDESSDKWQEVVARFGGLPMREILLGVIDLRDALTQVAEDLGITRPTLYDWLSKSGLRVKAGWQIEATDTQTEELKKPSAEACEIVKAVLEVGDGS